MPTIAEPRDLFLNDLKGALYVEQQLADIALPQLLDEIADAEFKAAISQHLDETKQHVASVERAFELLGEEAKADKSHAVDGLIAQHDKVVKNIESDEVRDFFDACAAAKTEHLEIAMYEGMIAAAESLGEQEIVALLEEILDQEKNALELAKQTTMQLAQQTSEV